MFGTWFYEHPYCTNSDKLLFLFLLTNVLDVSRFGFEWIWANSLPEVVIVSGWTWLEEKVVMMPEVDWEDDADDDDGNEDDDDDDDDDGNEDDDDENNDDEDDDDDEEDDGDDTIDVEDRMVSMRRELSFTGDMEVVLLTTVSVLTPRTWVLKSRSSPSSSSTLFQTGEMCMSREHLWKVTW